MYYWYQQYILIFTMKDQKLIHLDIVWHTEFPNYIVWNFYKVNLQNWHSTLMDWYMDCLEFSNQGMDKLMTKHSLWFQDWKPIQVDNGSEWKCHSYNAGNWNILDQMDWQSIHWIENTIQQIWLCLVKLVGRQCKQIVSCLMINAQLSHYFKQRCYFYSLF